MCIHNTRASFLLVGIVWCCGSSLLYCLVSSAGGLSCKQLSKGNLLHSPFQKLSLLFIPGPVSLSVVVFFLTVCLSPSVPPPHPLSFCFSITHPHTHTHTNIPALTITGSGSVPVQSPIVYWDFRCQWGRKDPAGLSASLTPLSQWVPLPSHSFPCQAGKSKYLSAPHNNGQLGGERDFDQSSCEACRHCWCLSGPKDGLQED